MRKYRQEWKKMRGNKLGFPLDKDFQRNKSSSCTVTPPERVTHGCINNKSEGQNQGTASSGLGCMKHLHHVVQVPQYLIILTKFPQHLIFKSNKKNPTQIIFFVSKFQSLCTNSGLFPGR